MYFVIVYILKYYSVNHTVAIKRRKKPLLAVFSREGWVVPGCSVLSTVLELCGGVGGGQPGLGGGAAGAGAWRQEWAWRDEAWAWPGAGRGGPGSSGHPGGRWQRRRFSPPQAPCRSSACSRRWAPWRPPSGARSISAPSSWALSPSCSLRTSSKAGARRTSLRGPGACLSWETSSTWTLKSRSWRFSG